MLEIETFICMLCVTLCSWTLVLRIYMTGIMLEIDSHMSCTICNILLLEILYVASICLAACSNKVGREHLENICRCSARCLLVVVCWFLVVFEVVAAGCSCCFYLLFSSFCFCMRGATFCHWNLTFCMLFAAFWM